MCFHCYGNLKFQFAYNGKMENWPLLLSHCRYFDNRFTEMFSFFILYIVAMETERLKCFYSCLAGATCIILPKNWNGDMGTVIIYRMRGWRIFFFWGGRSRFETLFCWRESKCFFIYCWGEGVIEWYVIFWWWGSLLDQRSLLVSIYTSGCSAE